jgi:hypothetical protein
MEMKRDLLLFKWGPELEGQFGPKTEEAKGAWKELKNKEPYVIITTLQQLGFKRIGMKQASI